MKAMLATAAAALTLTAGTALAGPAIWAVEVSATGSGVTNNAYAERFDTNGAKLQQVLLGTGVSPGGIAIVGNTAFVAATTDGVIRSFNLTTGVAGASITTGHSALGSLSADGTGFWANDYEGGNKAFHITFGGAEDKSVTLSGCGSYCNGLDYFTRGGSSFLIANRGESEASATYDLYSTTGTLVTSALLSNVPNGSGLSYNGAGFFVANSLNNALLSYSFAGALLSTTTLGGPIPDSGFGDARFVTDLATVPEPMSLALLASGLGVIGLMRRRA